MAKRKTRPKFDPTPSQIKPEDLWLASRSVWPISDYRGLRDNPEVKIRTRLFYRGDDIPNTTWMLPVADDIDILYSWIGQLVTTPYDFRVGAMAAFLNENYLDDDDDYDFDRHVLLFENKNDMIMFKLSVK